VVEDTKVDFALVAFREDERWQVGELPARAASDLEALFAALRQQPSDGVRLALCSYGDDFFLAVRPESNNDVRLMISDVTAVEESPLARQALELMDDAGEGPEDLDTMQPAGDLEMFADLGLGSMELSLICSDLDAYPDELLAQIATRIGFGPQFERAVEADLP